MAATASAGISLLPVELLCEVLGYLEGKDLLNAILVNRQWKAIGLEHKWRDPGVRALIRLSNRGEDVFKRYTVYVRTLRFDSDNALEMLSRLGRINLASIRLSNVRAVLFSYRNTGYALRSWFSHAIRPFLAHLAALNLTTGSYPLALFKTLRESCFTLRSLSLAFSINFWRDQDLENALADLEHLPCLLEQCSDLLVVNLDMRWPDPGFLLSVDTLSILAASKIKKLILKSCHLPQGVASVLNELVSTPFARLEILDCEYTDATEVIETLHGRRTIERFESLRIRWSPVGYDCFEAVAGCSTLQTLVIDLDDFDPASLLTDIAALRRAVSLNALSLRGFPISNHSGGFSQQSATSAWPLIDTLTCLSGLKHLRLDMGGSDLLSEQLFVLGIALPRLVYLKAPFALCISKLVKASLGDFISRDADPFHTFYTMNANFEPDGCRWTDHGDIRTLFPKLETLKVRKVLFPDFGSLLNDISVPEEGADADWSEYVERRAKMAAMLVLDEMPQLRHFSLLGG